MHVSVSYASSVKLGTCLDTWTPVYNHMNVLSPGACGATRWHQRIQTCTERLGGRVLNNNQSLITKLKWQHLNEHTYNERTTTKEMSIAILLTDTHSLWAKTALYCTNLLFLFVAKLEALITIR